jgi:hypothetical protein
MLMASEFLKALEKCIELKGDRPIIIEYVDKDKKVHITPITQLSYIFLGEILKGEKEYYFGVSNLPKDIERVTPVIEKFND